MNAAWIDLETTGTDETDGSVLEVGLVVATAGGTVLDFDEWLVAPDPTHLAALDPVVYEMHRTSGLLAEIEDVERSGGLPPVATVDAEVAAVLDRWTVNGRIILAGSGVAHFDARWIRRHLPSTARRLTYWTWDVGVVRRFLATVDLALVVPPPDKAHRGLADARDHLAEWRHYRDLIREKVTPTG